MPKIAKELSAAEVRRLTYGTSKDGNKYNAFHAVGGVSGLVLQVTPASARSWLLRTVVGTQRRSIGLGGFPDVSLSDARKKAQQFKDQIRGSGIDPVEVKKENRRRLIEEQLSTITFNDAAAQYLQMKSLEFKNPRQAKQWQSSLASYAAPHIGIVPVSEICLPHIKAVLDPIWTEKTETANRVRSRIENILDWCAVHGFRTNDNPARWKGYLDDIYPAKSKIQKRRHHIALSVKDIPSFMRQLQTRKAVAAQALEFLILTASRTNEVIGDKRIGKLGMVWGEVDFDKQVWIVPSERMKGGKEHKVPLTDAALAVLKKRPQGAPGSLVFPANNGAIPSNNFLSALLKRMDAQVTVHGFRSTFKDWARENTEYADEVSELALSHVNDDATRAAYARSQLIDKRRLLMNDWAKYLIKPVLSAEVINIRDARS